MPGLQGNRKQLPPFLMIAVLDCGHPTSLKGDPTTKEYGYSLG
jgi:hypothetical protein